MNHWILQVSAGVGPIEVRHFVSQLTEALVGHCEERGLQVASMTLHGDEAAPRSAEIEVIGEARAVLAGYLGTHVLVAKSRRRGRHGRKRWFAGVSLHAAVKAADVALLFSPDEIEVTTCRAGGPGGQHVNTTDSAVRVRHKATGVSVRVASERSQHHNRRRALERLAAILAEREAAKKGERHRDLRLSHYQFERGSAVQEWTTSAGGLRLESHN